MPAAHAATGDLTCTANFQFNLNPALTASQTTSRAKATAGFVGRTSLDGTYSALKNAIATTISPGTVTSAGGTPCNLLVTIAGLGAITWNTTHSGFHYTINADPTKGTITLSAKIDNGPLAGGTITAVPVLARPNLEPAPAARRENPLRVAGVRCLVDRPPTTGGNVTRMSLPTPRLHTARLRLRPFDDADANDLFALHSSAYVLRYWDAPPWRERVRSGLPMISSAGLR